MINNIKNRPLKSTQNIKHFPTRPWAAITALALGSAILVAPQSTGLVPEARAGVTCTNPTAPLTGSKAEGTVSSPSNWNQKVIASTDKSTVYPGDTFIYRIQVGSTFNWTAMTKLVLSMPEGFSVTKITNPYSSYCGYANLENTAYPTYQGDRTNIWSVTPAENANAGDGENRQVDFHIKVGNDAEVNSNATFGLGLEVRNTFGLPSTAVSAEKSAFGPSIWVSDKVASLQLHGQELIANSKAATVEAEVTPPQAKGRVFFSVAGQEGETPVTVKDGKATWSTPSPTGEDFDINARFVSSNGFGTAQAQPHHVQVKPTQTQVTLSHPPKAQPGDSVTLTSTVTPVNVEGAIVFTWTTANGVDRHEQSVPVAGGQASTDVTFPSVGNSQLSAQFVPAEGSPVAASPVTHSEINIGQGAGAQKKQSEITLDLPDSNIPGEPIELAAHVPTSGAQGEVEFYVEGEKVGSSQLVGGNATYSYTAGQPGQFAVQAKFVPTSAHLPSESLTSYLAVRQERAVIESVSVDETALALEPVQVSATLQQADAQGVVRFYLGINPATKIEPQPDNLTVVDVPVTDGIASTSGAYFAQTGDRVPVYAEFIPAAGSAYARSEAKTAYSKVAAPRQKDPRAGAVSFDNINLNLSSEDKVYHSGDLIKVHVHLDNNEPFTSGFTYVNEVGIYAPKGFEYVRVSGSDVSGKVNQSESLIDTKDSRFTGFKLARSTVASNSFPGFGSRDFTVIYRVTDAAVSGTPNFFQTRVNLHGAGDDGAAGTINAAGQAVTVISGIVGPLLGATWGELVKSGGKLVGSLLKTKDRKTYEPRTVEDMPVKVEGTSGTGNPNPGIASEGSSDIPSWVQILLGALGSLGLISVIGAALVHFFNIPLPSLPRF